MVPYNPMIIALSAIVGRTLLTYLYDEKAAEVVRLCAGGVIGLAGLGLTGFMFASVPGLTPLSLALTTVTAASPLMVLTGRRHRAQVRADIEAIAHNIWCAIVRPDHRVVTYFIFYTIVTALFWLF